MFSRIVSSTFRTNLFVTFISDHTTSAALERVLNKKPAVLLRGSMCEWLSIERCDVHVELSSQNTVPTRCPPLKLAVANVSKFVMITTFGAGEFWKTPSLPASATWNIARIVHRFLKAHIHREASSSLQTHVAHCCIARVSYTVCFQCNEWTCANNVTIAKIKTESIVSVYLISVGQCAHLFNSTPTQGLETFRKQTKD